MPDYGTRLPPYTSDQGVLGQAPYGWAGTPVSDISNAPSNSQYFPADQFVYERLDWQKFKDQIAKQGIPGGGLLGSPLTPFSASGYWSNPPFLGAGQMTGPNGAPSWMQDEKGGTGRILRGYLRRQNVEASHPESFVRLYFMYNPDQVQRSYLSWTDSTTLDPANALGADSSKSPASVPSLTQLQFTLYFDRQIEVATIKDHPGVMVDLQAFDFMTGNMTTTQDAAGGTATTVLPPGMHIPDNTDTTENHAGQLQAAVSNVAGDVAAIFSPSLMVEGILASAGVVFTKFSPKMTPTTMQLTITLAVRWAGKTNNQTTNADQGAGVLPGGSYYDPKTGALVPTTSQSDRNAKTKEGAQKAVTYAEQNLMDSQGVHYDSTSPKRDAGPPCNLITPAFTDCSSLVWRAFHAVGWVGTEQGDALRLKSACGAGAPSSGDFVTSFKANGQDMTGVALVDANQNRCWRIIKHITPADIQRATTDTASGGGNVGSLTTPVAIFKDMRPGDILVREQGHGGAAHGHVAFFYGSSNVTEANWKNTDVITLLMSSGTPMPKGQKDPDYYLGGNITTTSMFIIWGDTSSGYDWLVRPEPWGPTTDYSSILGGEVQVSG